MCRTLACASENLQWEDRLTFVGTILDFNGNDGFAVDLRIAQATKVLFKWRNVLQNANASFHRRVELSTLTFMSALLWLSETWHPTQRQIEFMDSWAARMIARACCLKRRSEEEPTEYWRRLHRFGHDRLKLYLGGANVQRRRKLHGLAGHLARMTDGWPYIALRTRSLAWWRAFQRRDLCKHPKRFHVWRWEQQLVTFYGEAASMFVDDNVGWMEQAQNRASWKANASAFAEHICIKSK